MSIQPSASRNQQDQRKHLAKVLALSREMASAIECIEHNDLEGLQSSVARQESLCNEVAGIQWPAPGKQNDSRLMNEIRSAHTELAQQNRLYKAVLKRAQRSAGLVLALYRHYGRGYNQDAPAPTDNHTWSCEA